MTIKVLARSLILEEIGIEGKGGEERRDEEGEGGEGRKGEERGKEDGKGEEEEHKTARSLSQT